MCMQSCCFLFIQIFIVDMKCIMYRDTKVICSNCTLCVHINRQGGEKKLCPSSDCHVLFERLQLTVASNMMPNKA